jgi:aminomethyltransferase
MGQFEVSGAGATAYLNALVSANWNTVRIGRAAYGLLLAHAGGVLDDVMGYRLGEERWLVVVNASRVEVDEGCFARNCRTAFRFTIAWKPRR